MAPIVMGRPLYFADVVSFFFLSSFFLLSSFFVAACQRWEIGCLPYFHLWCGLRANLEYRSEMCCTRLAENARRENDTKNSQSVPGYSTLYIRFRRLLPPNGILPGAKFILRPSLAFSYIGSVTARHSSSGRQPNCGVQQRVSPIFGRAAITLGIGPHSSSQ